MYRRATQGIIRLIPWGRHTVVVDISLLFDGLNARSAQDAKRGFYVASEGEGGGAAVAWTPPRCTAAAA